MYEYTLVRRLEDALTSETIKLLLLLLGLIVVLSSAAIFLILFLE